MTTNERIAVEVWGWQKDGSSYYCENGGYFPFVVRDYDPEHNVEQALEAAMEISKAVFTFGGISFRPLPPVSQWNVRIEHGDTATSINDASLSKAICAALIAALDAQEEKS